MLDEIRNAFNVLHNIVEHFFYAITFILPQISNKFWANFLETETLRNYSSMSNYFLQYFLNLCILFVYKFNPNLHNHSKTLGSRKEVLHSFDAEKHLKKVKYSYLCGQMNGKPASLWLIVTQNIRRMAASFASNI